MAKQNSYRRIILAGVAGLGALAVFAIVARRTFLRYEFQLVTFVDDSAGITPSSPVLLHGISIGHVRRVSLSGSKDPNRTVRIDMIFSRDHLPQIPEDSTIAITASNLLGDKSLDISRGVHSEHIVPGAEIKSTATEDINSVLDRGKQPLKQVDNMIDRVNRILQIAYHGNGTAGLLANDKSFQKRIEGINANLNEMQARYKGGRGALLRMTELEADAKKPMARFNELAADFDHGKGTAGLLMHDPNNPTLSAEGKAAMDEARGIYDTAAKDKRFPDMMKQVSLTGDKASALLQRAEKGQGTAGMLMSSSELSDTLKSLNAEFDSFVADFKKHPRSFVAIRLF